MTMQSADLLQFATTFMFPIDPTAELRYQDFDSVWVELRDTDAWAVTNGRRQVMRRDGSWEHEPSPSSRSDGFLARTRFPRGEAIRLALAEVERRRAERRRERAERTRV